MGAHEDGDGPRFLHQHAPGSGKIEIICLLASELHRLGKADSVVVLNYAAPGPCDLRADYTSHMTWVQPGCWSIHSVISHHLSKSPKGPGPSGSATSPDWVTRRITHAPTVVNRSPTHAPGDHESVATAHIIARKARDEGGNNSGKSVIFDSHKHDLLSQPFPRS